MSYLDITDLDGLVDHGQDATTVQKWISKAEVRLARLVQRRGFSLSALAADPDRLSIIRDVLENAVVRVLRNPDGIKSESEGEYSYTANPLDSAGNIWFPDGDVDDIVPGRTSRFGTISLGLTDLYAGLEVPHSRDFW